MQATHSLLTLRIFVASARALSLSRAAERLNLTQSAASKHIRALEDRLGVALFTRHARGLGLTEAGAAFLGGAEAALAAIEGAEARVAALLRQGNRIAFAVPPAVAAWVAPAVAAFMRRHPDVTVVMRPRLPPAAKDAPAAEAAPDAEIRFGEGHWPGMRSRYLLGRETCLVGSPGLLAELRLASPGDLAARGAPLLRHVLVPQAWPAWLTAMGLPPGAADPHGASDYEQYSTLLAAALAGLGLAVVPHFLVAAHLRAGTLVAPFGEVVRLQAGYHLLIPDSRGRSTPLRLFAEHLAREAARVGRAALAGRADAGTHSRVE
jgi:DNA-binding transcriptional LysR family regulator